MADRLEILEKATRGTDLLNRAQRTLSQAPSEAVQSLAVRVPTEITPADEKVKVVFAGQYSAGKSTILRALTGREDIVVGAGITTQQTHPYEWEGVEVVDTPGVHADRPDHDEITYQAIADADLLVFVVTNELFDSHLAGHFRKLAIERDKAHEMMLVVNKMRRSPTGNSPEMQRVLCEDLRKVLTPFSPEKLRISFIDAEAELESRTEKDEAIAKALKRASGFGVFVDALNTFVRDKNLTGRYTTALYNLEQVLQEARTASSLDDDTEANSIKELLLQRRRIILETRQSIPRAVTAQVSDTAAQIREAGRKVAELLHGDADPQQINLELEAAQQSVQEHTITLNKDVQNTVIEHVNEMDQRDEEIAGSELAREVLPRLAILLEDQAAPINISPETAAKLKAASGLSHQLGKFLLSKSQYTKEALLSPEWSGFLDLPRDFLKYHDTATAQQVTKIGTKFGKNVSPVDAAKWSRGFTYAGRALALGGVALSAYLQYKEEQNAAQRERELRESRSVVRENFNEAAHTLETHYDEVTNTYVADTLNGQIAAIDQQLENLTNAQQSHDRLFKQLDRLLNETRSLIQDLHTVAG